VTEQLAALLVLHHETRAPRPRPSSGRSFSTKCGFGRKRTSKTRSGVERHAVLKPKDPATPRGLDAPSGSRRLDEHVLELVTSCWRCPRWIGHLAHGGERLALGADAVETLPSAQGGAGASRGSGAPSASSLASKNTTSTAWPRWRSAMSASSRCREIFPLPARPPRAPQRIASGDRREVSPLRQKMIQDLLANETRPSRFRPGVRASPQGRGLTTSVADGGEVPARSSDPPSPQRRLALDDADVGRCRSGDAISFG